MSLDFPTSPTDGDLHVANNSTWQWQASPGLWKVVQSGVPTEIVEANTTTRWQVVGDVLHQWGVSGTTDANGLVTVTLPKSFEGDNYAAGGSVQGLTAVTSDRTVNVGTLTASSLPLYVSLNGAASSGVACRWWAVGEAPDSLKKPKSIQAAGGLYVQEYHDPTGVASWRIMGTTFEQWGQLLVPNGGYSSYGYARTLTSSQYPAVTVTAINGASINAELTSATDTNFGIVTRVSTTAATVQSWVAYHVIGELA